MRPSIGSIREQEQRRKLERKPPWFAKPKDPVLFVNGDPQRSVASTQARRRRPVSRADADWGAGPFQDSSTKPSWTRLDSSLCDGSGVSAGTFEVKGDSMAQRHALQQQHDERCRLSEVLDREIEIERQCLQLKIAEARQRLAIVAKERSKRR